jgi:hypothetical protein
MPGDLEKIVRPFEQERVFTARFLPPAQPITQDDEDAPSDEIVLEWGAEIEHKYKQWSFGTLAGTSVKWQEVSRVTDIVRVTNPSDTSQFVDVERIRKLTVKNIEGQEQEFDLNWPEP